MERIDSIRQLITGTTIDPNSFLSTDYFNLFNEPIMVIGMLPDVPEMLDEVDGWRFRTYCEHFQTSGLPFAALAIDAYDLAPSAIRHRFDKVTVQISMLIVETRVRLRFALQDGDMDRFREMAELHALELQGMIDDGGAIVHGDFKSSDQLAVDALF